MSFAIGDVLSLTNELSEMADRADKALPVPDHNQILPINVNDLIITLFYK